MTAAQSRGEGWVPSNTHPPNTRFVASCCDTLYLNLGGRIDGMIAFRLEELRSELLDPKGSRALRYEDAEGEFEIDGVLLCPFFQPKRQGSWAQR